MEQNASATFLVICNSTITLRFFENHLGENTHIVDARNPEIALEILSSTKIDTVIVDEEVVDGSPVDLMSKIRKTPGYASAPLFYISSSLKRSFMKQMVNAGVTDFLSVPLNEQELSEKLEVASRKQKTTQKMSAITGAIGTQTITAPKERVVISETALGKIQKEIEAQGSMNLLMITIDDAEALRPHLRSQDTLVSLGSSKYAILLPNTSERAAKLIATNLSEALKTEVNLITEQTGEILKEHGRGHLIDQLIAKKGKSA
ncbi:MAG: response regulator [Simkaniaceae bacterium]|nr:response regulator [Simkaniaceae bacterium]